MQRLNLFKTTEFRVLLGVACGLTAVYVLLLFSTLAAEGLGGFFLLVEYTFWVGVAGVILVIVAFFFGWLPYHEWWMVSAVAAWVLVPIVGGFFAALAILWGSATLYASPQFATWYRDAAGISIAPEDPTIAYAGCRPGTYSAAYRITAARPIDLLFTLEDRNGIRAVDAGDLPRAALAEQLAYVGEGTRWTGHPNWLGTPLGVYRVAAGEHVLLLHGAAPFQLGIFGAQPLWAPDRISGIERFQRLYGDNRTWPEVTALARRLAPAGCPDTCMRGDIPPPEEPYPVSAATRGSTALGSVVGEQAVDSSGNGLYDMLEISVTIAVTSNGDYELAGTLTDAAGQGLVAAGYSSPYTEPLCTGVYTVPLRFDGAALGSKNTDGPYTLTGLSLTYRAPGVEFPQPNQVAGDVYTTAPYDVNQFEGATVGPPAHSTHRVADQDGDGLYDQLTIAAAFATLHPPGQYTWAGTLRGAGGCEVGTAGGTGPLDKRTTAQFVFPGSEFHNSGCDGPYTLADVRLTLANGSAAAIGAQPVYTTPAYKAAQFDNFPIVLGSSGHAVPTGKDNDWFDRLVITTTVVAVDPAAGVAFTWRGDLLGANGEKILTDGESGQLTAASALTFTFSGPAIRGAGIDGPYTLSNVTIRSQATPALSVTLDELYTTPVWGATNFEP